MFFDVVNLCLKKQGKFAIAWVAATRGINHVSNKQAIAVDISVLCDEIMKMVTSGSLRPRQRLSLSLSAKLMNGTIKIYAKQITIFYEDIIKFLTTIRKPIIVEIRESSSPEELEAVPVEKKRRRRKVPSSWEQTIKESILHTTVAPREEITLKEKPSTPKPVQVPGFGPLTEEEAARITEIDEDIERETKRLRELSERQLPETIEG